jgi:hypothetical protein
MGPRCVEQTYVGIVKDETGRSIDGHGSRIGRRVWDLSSVELESIKLGGSRSSRERLGSQ